MHLNLSEKKRKKKEGNHEKKMMMDVEDEIRETNEN